MLANPPGIFFENDDSANENLIFLRAKTSYHLDIDGNKYIDFLQAGGPTVLGSGILGRRKKHK